MNNDTQSKSIENKIFINNAVTCRGGRDENQDTCGIENTKRGLLVVVCDGMGGANGGALASQLAVKEIIGFIKDCTVEESKRNEVPESASMLLTKAIRKANIKLIETSTANPELAGMGTTVTALLIDENCATAAYVGDSRIYQLRGGKKVYRTFDHSMVFELVKKKIINEEQARLSSDSNIILRALGQKEDISVDVKELTYDKGDRFLLCTDGVWGTMPEKELLIRLSEKKHPKVITETLIRSIHTESLKAGGHHDNLTAALIQTTTNSKIRNKMEQLIKRLIYVCAALLSVSLVFNIVQCSSSPKNAQEECKVILNEYKSAIQDKDTATYQRIDSIVDEKITAFQNLQKNIKDIRENSTDGE